MYVRIYLCVFNDELSYVNTWWYIYMYACVGVNSVLFKTYYIYVRCLYIYIYLKDLHRYIHTYVYTYAYMHLHKYVYIYIYTEGVFIVYRDYIMHVQID